MKAFANYHPIVLFSYFILAVGLTMFYMHPVYLMISLLLSIILSLQVNKKAFLRGLKWIIPMIFIAAIINPLISHDGEKIILYIDNNPITIEAITYGFAMSIMICSVIFWFGCYNVLMSSDKFLYLFGKISPAFALIISLTLRLVPRFKHQIGVIAHAQKTIGMDVTSGNLFHRIKCGNRIISILITWALENAIETADSMKARGYGLPRRSTFSLFTFEKRDGFMLIILLLLTAISVLGSFLGYNNYYFYPTFSELTFQPISILLYGSYTLLLAIPIIIELWEAFKWRLLISNN
ncbi:energy-coupling factor transporter transmembrane component T [Rummeliibacillus pycnus]|uniref:energy-coupling factor transporter transmembrane component T n=1 Tax=Rummeliibacillus pycnus TaxID=101070 RepID=UPI001FE43455|nr:energy-coupling factor transporter transmembrane component T [Rummeliibacillus pycnus]